MKNVSIFSILKNASLFLLPPAALFVCISFFAWDAQACSVMMKTNKQGVFIGRTTDYFIPVKSKMEIIPVGIVRHDPVTKFSWKVKYGMVGLILSDYNYLVDGINQKGVSAHILLQEDATISEQAPGKNNESLLSWTEYVLTTSATVSEAVANLQNLQIVNVPQFGKSAGLPHLAIFDKSGDAAVIEFNSGKMEIFHGPQYKVLTNAPNMHDQLANLARIREEKTQFSINQLPGGADAKNRFVRASFNMDNMPEPADPLEGVIYMESAVHDISVPLYIDQIHPASALSDAWATRWSVVYDLKNMLMFFDFNQTGKRVNLDIRKVNFKGKAVRYIDLEKQKSYYQLQ